mgnify:CR=1 FL=1
MTRIILLERLRAFTEEVTADLIMPTRLQKGDTEQSFRPAKVYLTRLPEGTSATKKAPYRSEERAAPGHYRHGSTAARTACDLQRQGPVYLLCL